MNRTVIYIDGELADMAPGTVVASTFRLWSIGDIKSRSVSHTNRIKLPLTPNNNQIFQYAYNHASTTRKPYQLVDVKILQDGIEILQDAVGLLRMVGAAGYELEVYDRTKRLFDAIEGKFVDEIDLGVYGPFDDTFLDLLANDTTPAGCPVIDYGRMIVPHQEISNDEFSSLPFDPWETPTSDSPYYGAGRTEWGSSSGQISVQLGTVSPANSSARLFSPYKFYNGKSYRVIIQCEVTSGTTTGVLVAYFMKEVEGVAVQQTLAPETDISTVGVHYLDITATSDNDYDYIGIVASQVAGGTTKEVELLKIDIIPQHVINIEPPYYVPTLNYQSVIQKIITDSGFSQYPVSQFATADNTFLSNLNITFSKSEFKYSQRFVDKFRFKAMPDGTQVITATETAQTVQFPTIDYNGSEGRFNTSTFIYSAPLVDYDLRIKLYVRLTVNVTALASTSVNISLDDGALSVFDDAGNRVFEVISSTGEHTFELETGWITIGSGTAKSYFVRCWAGDSSTPNTVEITQGYYYVEVDRTPISRIHASNLILPEMLQKDFFADYLYRVGGLIRESIDGVIIKPINQIINGRSTAKDWTLKRDASIPDEVTFLYDEYAQSNYFTDSPDDAPDSQGVMVVDNLQLATEKTIYTSPFIAVEQQLINGIQVCRVPIWDFETNDPLKVSGDFEPGVRLVYLRDGDTNTDPTIEYNGVTETQYTIATYGEIQSTHKANWQYFIDRFYSEFKTALDSTRIIKRSYMLTALDINQLDLLELIYDNGQYYIVLAVENFVLGKVTKVRLFKVS